MQHIVNKKTGRHRDVRFPYQMLCNIRRMIEITNVYNPKFRQLIYLRCLAAAQAVAKIILLLLYYNVGIYVNIRVKTLN